ncbi:MAG: DUF3795 domain-containing protein [Candidatus Neomarinimicrobiota bacterium]
MPDRNIPDEEMLGCCGAYCKTCKAFTDRSCRGCKIGYLSGERDLSKARCKMKVYCLNKGLTTCADCPDFNSCEALNAFFIKNGYKYKKYHEALDYIRSHGYPEFFTCANQWTMQYGKYPQNVKER